MNKKIMLLLVLLVVIIGAYFIWKDGEIKDDSYTNSSSSTPVVISHTATLGEHCGGNMTTAKVCSSGLHCTPTPGSHLPFGDVGGICVKN